MPRTLKSDPLLTQRGRLAVMAALKHRMIKQNISFRDLAEKLNELGFEENERNIRTKVSKGEMPASLFVILLSLLGDEQFPIMKLKDVSEMDFRDVFMIAKMLHDEKKGS